MLHRMEGLGLWGFQGPDREEAVVLGRRALGWAALAGVMFLLCRVQASLLAPFGMAFLAAALLAGRSAGALLAGCLGALAREKKGYFTHLEASERIFSVSPIRSSTIS